MTMSLKKPKPWLPTEYNYPIGAVHAKTEGGCPKGEAASREFAAPVSRTPSVLVNNALALHFSIIACERWLGICELGAKAFSTPAIKIPSNETTNILVSCMIHGICTNSASTDTLTDSNSFLKLETAARPRLFNEGVVQDSPTKACRQAKS